MTMSEPSRPDAPAPRQVPRRRSRPLKSRSGYGTIARVPSGRLRVQLMIGGARLSETFDTLAECDAWLDEQLGRVERGGTLDGPRTTVATLVERFLELCETKGLAPTTRQHYRWLSQYVRAALGTKPLGEVTTADLDRFYTRLRQGAPRQMTDGRVTRAVALSPKSIRNAHGFISAMLNQAIDWRLITENVAARAKPPKVPKHRHAYWKPETMLIFLEAIEGERLEAAFWIMLSCGLRRGELVGLRDEDLRSVAEPETGTRTVLLTVQRQVVRLAGGQGLYIGAPKAQETRVVALEERAAAKLAAWFERRSLDRQVAGSAWRETGYLFTTTIGTLIEPRNLERTFKQLVVRHGLPPLGLHGLRHSYARALLINKESSKAVQQALGHATHAMTVDLYGDAIEGTERQVARTIGRALRRPD
jgi:integrase